MSQGELYTFVTNKQGKGKQGSLVAVIRGTRAKDIVRVLEKIPLRLRQTVKEVTLDMAKNMESASRQAFPEARLVTDRFHVVKLVLEALQHTRIKYRWAELDIENKAIEKCKKSGKKYKAPTLENGDTPKQLLARSRYIIAKKPAQWTMRQLERATMLFDRYPKIRKAYRHVLQFRSIYELESKSEAIKSFTKWIGKTEKLGIKEFNTAANSVKNNIDNILNFFDNRNTNANAESFNSKIKLFRANLRGVTDTKFFLFRLQNLFA